jgi:hypothetical protein
MGTIQGGVLVGLYGNFCAVAGSVLSSVQNKKSNRAMVNHMALIKAQPFRL